MASKESSEGKVPEAQETGEEGNRALRPQASATEGTESQEQPRATPEARPGDGQPEGAAPEGASVPASPQAEPSVDIEKILGQPEVAEQIRRRVQSEADKRLMRYQQQLEARRQAEEQRRRMEQMDDEDYGAFVRQQQQMEAYAGQRAQQRLAETYVQLTEQVLSSVEDETLRQRLAERNEANEFESFDAFLKARDEAVLEVEKQKMAGSLEKQIREAVQKELKANEAEHARAPVLGSGLPTTALDIKKMTPEQKILAGLSQRKKQT